MSLLRYLTKGDIILIVILVILSGASIAGIRNFYHGGKHVVIEVDGRHVMELPLDSNVTETLKGPLGETVIAVENGTVKIVESPCPHKYCIRMGSINRRSEIIVCVPNRVFITIRGGSKEESIDGVTQ
jgi:hypothetical protein